MADKVKVASIEATFTADAKSYIAAANNVIGLNAKLVKSITELQKTSANVTSNVKQTASSLLKLALTISEASRKIDASLQNLNGQINSLAANIVSLNARVQTFSTSAGGAVSASKAITSSVRSIAGAASYANDSVRKLARSLDNVSSPSIVSGIKESAAAIDDIAKSAANAAAPLEKAAASISDSAQTAADKIKTGVAAPIAEQAQIQKMSLEDVQKEYKSLIESLGGKKADFSMEAVVSRKSFEGQGKVIGDLIEGRKRLPIAASIQDAVWKAMKAGVDPRKLGLEFAKITNISALVKPEQMGKRFIESSAFSPEKAEQLLKVINEMASSARRVTKEKERLNKELSTVAGRVKHISRIMFNLGKNTAVFLTRGMWSLAQATGTAASKAWDFSRNLGRSASGIALGYLRTGLLAVESVLMKVGPLGKAAFGAVTRGVQAAARSVYGFSNNLKMMGYQLASLAARARYMLTIPIVAGGTAAVKTFADLQDSVKITSALMGGLSVETENAMGKQLMSVASKSINSATQLGESMKTLASAGYDASSAMTMLERIDRFAIGGIMDLSSATDILIGSQSALGMKSANAAENLANVTRIADVLVKANQISQGTVEDFGKALTNKGAAAIKLFNRSLEEGVAILSVYAAQGVTAETAGEKLWMLLRDIQRAAIKNSEEWKALGLTVFDASGRMLPVADILRQLETRFAGLSDETRRSGLMLLGFQDRSLAAVAQLMGFSGQIREYTRTLQMAGGATDEIANKRMTSFKSAILVLKNNIVNLFVTIGQMLAPTVLAVANSVNNLIMSFNNLTPIVQRAIVVALGAAAAIGPILMVTSLLYSAAGLFVQMIAPIGLVISSVFTLTNSFIILLSFIPNILSGIVGLGMVGSKALLLLVSPVTILLSGFSSFMGILASTVGSVGKIFILFGSLASIVSSVIGLFVSGFGFVLIIVGAVAGVFALIVTLFYTMKKSGGSVISYLINQFKWWKDNVIGFFYNFKFNMLIIFDFFRDNWKLILSDIGRAILVFAQNFLYNFTIMFKAGVRLFTLIFGFGLVKAGQLAMKGLVWTFTTGMEKLFGFLKGVFVAIKDLIVGLFTGSFDEAESVAAKKVGQLAQTIISDFGKGMSAARGEASLKEEIGKILSEAGRDMRSPLHGFQRQTPYLYLYTKIPEGLKRASNAARPLGRTIGGAAAAAGHFNAGMRSAGGHIEAMGDDFESSLDTTEKIRALLDKPAGISKGMRDAANAIKMESFEMINRWREVTGQTQFHFPKELSDSIRANLLGIRTKIGFAVRSAVNKAENDARLFIRHVIKNRLLGRTPEGVGLLVKRAGMAARVSTLQQALNDPSLSARERTRISRVLRESQFRLDRFDFMLRRKFERNPELLRWSKFGKEAFGLDLLAARKPVSLDVAMGGETRLGTVSLVEGGTITDLLRRIANGVDTTNKLFKDRDSLDIEAADIA